MASTEAFWLSTILHLCPDSEECEATSSTPVYLWRQLQNAYFTFPTIVSRARQRSEVVVACGLANHTVLVVVQGVLVSACSTEGEEGVR